MRRRYRDRVRGMSPEFLEIAHMVGGLLTPLEIGQMWTANQTNQERIEAEQATDGDQGADGAQDQPQIEVNPPIAVTPPPEAMPQPGQIGMEVRDPRARARGLSPEALLSHLRGRLYTALLQLEDHRLRNRLPPPPPRNIPCLPLHPACAAEVNAVINDGLQIKEVCMLCWERSPTYKGDQCGCVTLCQMCFEGGWDQMKRMGAERARLRMEAWHLKWNGHNCTAGLDCNRERERQWASDPRPSCLNCIVTRTSEMISVRYSARIRAMPPI